MLLVSRLFGGSVSVGLLTLLVSGLPGVVSAQSDAPRYSNNDGRIAKFAHRNPSGNTTEIVEGGTYYDDGNGNLVPAGTAAARAIAGPAAKSMPPMASSPTARPAAVPVSRPAANPVARPVANPVARPAANPVVRPAANPVPRPAANTTVRQASRRMAEPVDEPVMEVHPGSASGVTFGALDEACCDDGSCGACSLEPCCGFPLLPLDNLDLFVGAQGFTGPPNRGSTGSFGFHEGVNWAAPFPLLDSCLGMQFGARAVQANLSGADFTDASRTQLFVTAGLFRRVDMGLQGGIVIDALNDSWYRSVSLVNLRGELSWVFDGCDDIGFWFTKSTGESTTESVILERVVNADNVTTLRTRSVTETWRPTDLYAFFFRRQFGECQEGEARIFGGFTGQSDGLLGVDARLPLSQTWSLETGFTYLMPQQGNTGIGLDAGHAQESWNLGISLVWTPGRAFSHADSHYYRALFRVADNGVFMMDRK